MCFVGKKSTSNQHKPRSQQKSRTYIHFFEEGQKCVFESQQNTKTHTTHLFCVCARVKNTFLCIFDSSKIHKNVFYAHTSQKSVFRGNE